MRFANVAAVSIFLVTVTIAPAAQAPAPAAQAAQATQAPGPPPPLPAPPGRVTGIISFGHVVTDLDKSIQFYKDAFGLEVSTAAAPRAAANPLMQKLTGLPGVRSREAILKLPESGFNLRLLELSGIDRKPPAVTLKTDPGVTNLQVRIKDMTSALATLQKSGAQTWPAGKPLVQPFRKSIFVRDIDGYIVEVVEQTSPRPAFVPGVTMTSAQVDFYQDVLEIPMQQRQWASLPASYGTILPGEGVSVGQMRRTLGTIPGTTVPFELNEYTGLKPTTFKPRIQDPAATLLSLRVRDMDKMLEILRNAKVPIVSVGGVPVQMPGSRNLVIQDPEGVFIELVEQR